MGRAAVDRRMTSCLVTLELTSKMGQEKQDTEDLLRHLAKQHIALFSFAWVAKQFYLENNLAELTARLKIITL